MVVALCERKRGLVESYCGRQIWLQLGRVVLNGSPRVIWGGALEVTLDLTWVMERVSDFEMMCGVERYASRQYSQCCIILPW
jgi:hypothetical protein